MKKQGSKYLYMPMIKIGDDDFLVEAIFDEKKTAMDYVNIAKEGGMDAWVEKYVRMPRKEWK